MTAQQPESAPHCPRCGHNLFGSPELRCPECGHVIADAEELTEARWLADDNRENRRAVRNQWLMAVVGALLIGYGVTITILSVDWSNRRPLWGLAWTRYTPIYIAATAGYLIYRRCIGEPMYRVLLILGVAWLVGGTLMSLT